MHANLLGHLTLIKTGLITVCLLCLLASSVSYSQVRTQKLLSIDNTELLTSDYPIKPYGLLELSDKIHYIFWFALEQGQLLVIEVNGDDYDIIHTLDLSIGKLGYDKFFEGDKKTPIGLYHFEPFINDRDLHDKYGIGAFPVNYPNEYDKYRKRTGSGIWLHGLPKGVKNRPLRDSDGCMVINNVALQDMKQYITPEQTLVINQNYFQWASPAKTQNLHNEMQKNIDNWLLTWNTIKTEDYLKIYSTSFNNQKKNYQTWKKHKRRVNAHKNRIDVSISDLSMVLYPGSDDIIQVNFHQDYRSNNYSSTGKKIQLWKREPDNKWRIIFEDSK